MLSQLPHPQPVVLQLHSRSKWTPAQQVLHTLTKSDPLVQSSLLYVLQACSSNGCCQLGWLHLIYRLYECLTGSSICLQEQQLTEQRQQGMQHKQVQAPLSRRRVPVGSSRRRMMKWRALTRSSLQRCRQSSKRRC